MPLRALLAALLAIGSLAIPACVGSNGASGGGVLAPRIAGKTIDGDYIQLEDFRGKVVLVNVWATWCKPCRKELPELARLHTSLATQGFTVVGVTVDKPASLPLVRTMVAKHGLDYPMIFDPDGSAVGALAIKGYPTSVLIGRNGALRWRRDGIIRENDGELGKQIEFALEESVSAPPAKEIAPAGRHPAPTPPTPPTP